MLQVMSSLERQVHEYNAKETKLETIVKESKLKVEEALRQRDQAIARDVQNQKEISRLMDERKSILAAKQVTIYIYIYISFYI